MPEAEAEVVEAPVSEEGAEELSSEEIAEMSDEDLKKKSEEIEAEAGGEVEPEPKSVPEEKAPESESEAKKPEGDEEEAPAEETPAKAKEGEEEEEGAKAGEEEEPGEEDPATLKARIAELEADGRSRELRLDRQGNELGVLRQRAAELRQHKKMSQEEYDELHERDPREAERRDREDEHIREAADKAEIEALRAEGRLLVERRVPDLQKIMPEIKALAKRDGATDAELESFETNPYLNDPHQTVAYATEARHQLRIQALETELELSKRESGSVADKVAEAADKPKRLSGASGQGGGSPKSKLMSSEEIAAGTTEDLKERLSVLRREELV